MTTTLIRRCLPALVLLPVSLAVIPAQAGITTIGSMSAWQAAPSQTSEDKTFTWLASGTGWSGAELIFISYNPVADVHAMNFDTLTNYEGPLTLTVDYRVDITSNFVFAAIGLDTDTLSPNTAAYKDVFSSLALLEEAVGYGTGDLAALASVNGFPDATALPAIRQIWVRDTILLDASGQLNSVSNSVLQTVPEPSGVALAGLAVAALAARRFGGRRRPA